MDEIKKTILKRLYQKSCFGGKHTAIEHCMHGFPRHLAGEAKHAAQELIKENYLLAKPTSYGLQVSLNPEKKTEIELIIGA